MSTDSPSSREPQLPIESPPRNRRARYRGTHPRRFDERYKELDSTRFPDMQSHVLAQGRTPAGTHVPVLLNEVIAALRPRPGEIVADCTLGYGGHAIELLRRVLPGGRLIGFDVDAAALQRAARRIRDESATWQSNLPADAVVLRRGNFAGVGTALQELRLDGYDIILADLGVSSMQVDDPARGFAYKHDGPLDMRMDDRIPRTAADLLATMSEDELATALHDLADEPDHALIARAIVRQRCTRPVLRTRQLVGIILAAKGITHARPDGKASTVRRITKPHPAAATFQALRMLVNDELGNLKQLLRMAPWSLRPGGRMGVISFHSGEDRLVKQAFRDGLRSGVYSATSPDVIRPCPAERRANPRCTSAKLRRAVRASA